MAGISLILQNNPTVRQIDCGTSSPKLGGTINLSAFPNLQEFRCNNNDITAISGYEDNSNVRVIQFFNNKVTGSIPSLSGLTNLTDFRCNTNQLTGSIPSLSGSTNLLYFLCHNQTEETKLTGSIPSLNGLTDLRSFYCHTNQLTGPIPSVSGLTYLTNFSCSINQLTGSIPSLSGLTNLREFYCSTNQLTGTIPNLSGLTNLQVFSCSNQTGETKLTGPIPSLSGLTNLREFYCHTNQLTGFDGGSVSNTLGVFQAQSNQLTSTAVNAILAAFVAAGRTTGTPVVNGTCILNLGGVGNFRPTGQGVTDVTTLRNRGWTVTTGTL